MLNRRDDGSLTVLVIGYAAITIVLLVVGIAASKVFLARRALGAAADQASLQAAEAVRVARIYSTGLSCGAPLPISARGAAAAANAAWTQSRRDLRHTFSHLTQPQTSVRDGVVTVQVSGTVSLPFHRYLGWLDPGHSTVTVTETAHAQSPVTNC